MGLAFVTGASGFVGSHLVEALLHRGDDVRCLVRKSSAVDALKQAGAELVVGDVDQPEKLADYVAGADAVYHVAGLTCALKYERMLRINRDGVQNVIEACAAQPAPPTMVLVSSVAASGPTTRGQIRVEADPPAPISQYGESKLAGEKVAAARAGDVPLTIVRPGIVFGPRDLGQYAIFQTIKRFRFHPVPGFNHPPLSYIYVEDLAEILIRAAERGRRVPPLGEGPAGEGVYFGVANEYPNLADWGRMAKPLLRRPFAPIVPLPSPVPWLVAGCNEMLQQVRRKADMFNRDKIREASVESWACSPAASERDLGFTPPLPLAERLKETIGWYKDNRWL